MVLIGYVVHRLMIPSLRHGCGQLCCDQSFWDSPHQQQGESEESIERSSSTDNVLNTEGSTTGVSRDREELEIGANIV